MLARSGDITDPCPVPLSLTVTTPSSRMPALSHFWIKWRMRGSAIRCSKSNQPRLTDFIEKTSDVDLKYPVHPCAGDPDHQGVQRIVLAALGAEPIRKAKEILLVDRIQHRGSRPLDDFVFEGGNRDWTLSAVWFWYVQSAARLCPIRSSLDPVVQVVDLAIEVCLVFLPR